jgi:hypothetical protein
MTDIDVAAARLRSLQRAIKIISLPQSAAPLAFTLQAHPFPNTN